MPTGDERRDARSGAAPPPQERATTGIKGLDDVLQGGLPRNRLYAIHGGPGAGKTTLALQFLLAGERAGEPGLHVTLSESPPELNDIARSHGWSLDGLAIYEPPAVVRSMEMSTQTMFPPAEVELEELMKPLLEEVERVKPRRVVIDSISEIRLLARDPLRFRRELLMLKRYFAESGCTVLLIDGLADQAGFQLLETLAHGVISLERTPMSYGAPRGRITVNKLRGAVFREGRHDYGLRTGGIVVYPRLVAAEHGTGFRRESLSSAIPEIDALFGGGLVLCWSTLFIGPAGAGKSTLASLYAASAADRGLAVAMYLFAERRDTLVERSSALGMDLKRHIRSGLASVEEIDPAEVAPGELSDRVRYAVEDRDARLVVLDSLNGFFQTVPDESFLALHLHELLSYLNRKGVATILVLAQRGLVGELTQIPIDVSYLADAVVLLRFFEAKGEVRQAVSMLKKRSGGHERAIRELRITEAGVQVGPSLVEFQGVLTGIPGYRGSTATLLEGREEEADGDER